MKKNNIIIYVVIGILLIAFIMAFSGSSDEEASLSATNATNNTISMNIYKNLYTTNEIIENIIKEEILNTEKIETVSKSENQNKEKSFTTSSNVKTNSTPKSKQESTSKKGTNSTSKASTSTKSSKKTNSKTSISSNSSSSSISTSKSDETSETVWVGKTGTKYHRQSCGTLKGKGHKITLKEALAEGREPCKVCKP